MIDVGYFAGVGILAIPLVVVGYVIASILCGMIADNSSDNRARRRSGLHERQEDE